ncbi:phosphomannomutase/phosphoglucomutase [Patescibacteria group bacterium]|nr:phosphomannomutase/phosphoglucomutase [Patescibacteria group bacterium]MBU1890231.1 phosphomannomutase/phosphoglucomutase [Patescibacteria group bacterium]
MEKINPTIFRSYDIRGVYPEEIDENNAELIGQAFACYIKAKRIVVGRDMRQSSPAIHKAFCNGLLGQGVDVVDLGLVPSEVVYFAVGKYKYDGGAMITASHNPKEYNGIRMVNNQVGMIPGRELYKYIVNQRDFNNVPEPGKVETKNLLEEYIQHVLSFINTEEIKPLKAVIDAGNGMASTVIPELFKNLPGSYVPLFFELDGAFPNRPSNPILPESQAKLCQKVIEEKADLGVIFDGDGDRVLLITEQGEFVKGDISLALLAKYFLAQEPGAGISYTVICSRIVPETIKKLGGKPIRTPVGFINVSGGIRKHNGIMGGETSAHYCFRDNYYADSGLIALVVLLAIISRSGKKLSEVVDDLNIYQREEKYFETDKIEEALSTVKKEYSDGQQDSVDGLTVQYQDWWFNLRPSNTEPLLRLTIESGDEKLLNSKINDLTKLIENK